MRRAVCQADNQGSGVSSVLPVCARSPTACGGCKPADAALGLCCFGSLADLCLAEREISVQSCLWGPAKCHSARAADCSALVAALCIRLALPHAATHLVNHSDMSRDQADSSIRHAGATGQAQLCTGKSLQSLPQTQKISPWSSQLVHKDLSVSSSPSLAPGTCCAADWSPGQGLICSKPTGAGPDGAGRASPPVQPLAVAQHHCASPLPPHS